MQLKRILQDDLKEKHLGQDILQRFDTGPIETDITHILSLTLACNTS